MPYKNPETAKVQSKLARQRYQKKKTDAKILRLESEIASRQKWPSVDLAWAAGMFEGEGTITISSGGKNRGYGRSLVCLTNTNPSIIDFFQSRWPGIIYTCKSKSSHRIAVRWSLQNNGVIGFLEDVLPFFRTSITQQRATLILASQRKRWAGYKLSSHASEMAQVREEIKRLNLRGRVEELPQD